MQDVEDARPSAAIEIFPASSWRRVKLPEQDKPRRIQRRTLAGAALDVLDQEPPGAELDALKAVPHLILTPHIGWASRQARQRLVTALAEALESEIGGWS